MDVVVFGAGSLGSLVGGLLAREHEVTLVGRRPHVDAVAGSGLRVEGAVEAHVRPRATSDGEGLAADLAVVTVKAFDTEAAGRALATGEFRGVLSLQNGLGNEATLATHLDPPVLAGTATYGAETPEPGVVRCTGVGEVTLGAREGGASALADEVGAAFTAAGVETTVAEDMPRRLWSKLAVNAGINGVTALARVENGAVRGGQAGELAAEAARETARVARAEGLDVADEAAVDAVREVADATAANTSSTLQDVQAGRRTEVDALNGAVVDRGEASGVATPVNRTISGLLRAWERGHGVRTE
jgi:2-dehydropantoate 2-reductase